jgi:hypothetical protein
MSERLKQMLRDDIACYEASMMTTPHLSRIRHAEVALLALLEEPYPHLVVLDEADKPDKPVPMEAITIIWPKEDERPLRETLTLVDVLDGRGPL